MGGETGAQGQFPICQTTTSDNCHATSASQPANLLVGLVVPQRPANQPATPQL